MSHRLGEGGNGSLRRRVGALAGLGRTRRIRGNVHDDTGVPGDHPGQYGQGAGDGAEEIDGEDIPHDSVAITVGGPEDDIDAGQHVAVGIGIRHVALGGGTTR